MAAYTKATILANVRTILREPSARLYTDTELNAWIDEAARKVSILTLCNEVSEQVEDLSSGECLVACANDYIHVESAVLLITGAETAADRGLQRITPMMVGTADTGDGTNDIPRFYFAYGTGSAAEVTNIWVWPAPAVDSTYDLEVHGYTVVADYGSENLPEELQPLCIDYTTSLAYTKAGKHGTAATHMKRFIDRCSEARRDVYSRLGDATTLDQTRIPDTLVRPQ